MAADTFSYPALDVSVAAPTGGRTAGDWDDDADCARYWLTTTAGGDTGTVRIVGTAKITCATGDAYTAGDRWYISTGNVAVPTSSGGKPGGRVTASKAAGAGLSTLEVVIGVF